MTKNKSNKKKIILIFCGFLISIIVIVLLSILLFFLQSTSSVKQEPVSNVETNNQQEQETYNAILKKIETEVDELTTQKEIVYHPGSKTIKHIKIFDSQTKKEIKRINYVLDDGKTVKQIWEINPEGTIIKSTHYQVDGKTINWIKEINPEGNPTKITYYNPDGTVKEEKNL